MSDFIVSARKYRPSTFASVVGQEALSTTLRNAILTNKLSHAYLFCGPRGVGKTSCARIFAKTINCENRTPDGEACNECESCRAANDQRSYNITELDAASNNSVNDIRQLIEQVYIAPTGGRYRVYIIDEVHMLSSSAFNAFLKTLEEPPAHAIFILATTEKHKVLPTIISRCQVHDFSRITSQDIANHLRRIAQNENIEAEAEALQMIGIAADGGMRDALSMFDQIAGFGGGKITMSGVRQNLNLLDEDEYFSILGFILKGAHGQVLALLDRLLHKGYEGDIIMRGFSGFLRNILLSQSPETLNIVEVPHSIKERLVRAGQFTPPNLLWEFLKISTAFGTQYKDNNEKRLALEVALLKMCEKISSSSLNTVISPTNYTPPVSPNNFAINSESKGISAQEVEKEKSDIQGVEDAANGSPMTESKQSSTQLDPPQEIPKSSSKKLDTKEQPIGPSTRKLMSFDLMKGDRSVTEVQESTPIQSVKRDTPFTEEEFINAWRTYAHSQNTIISSILDQQDNLPIVSPDFKVLFKVTSNYEKSQMDELMPALVTHLSNQLHNDFISIQIEHTPENNNRLTPSSPKECLTILIKENPWFGQFTDDLGLEP